MPKGELTQSPSDPFCCNLHLPFTQVFHPLGFTLNLVSNSPEVLDCARESWGMWAPEYTAEPVTVQVLVEEEGDLALEPEYRFREHLFSIVSDRHNYAVLDLDRLFGYIFASRRTVADHAWFRWYYLDTVGLFLLEQRHTMALHAACIARDGHGILLAGESRAGKSSLSWACARAGWTYLADDATWVLLDGGRELMGRPHLARFRTDAPALFPELSPYVSRVRPNGKLSIEVATSEFPFIQTASRCQAAAVVFLDRAGDRAPGFERLDPDEAVEQLVGGLVAYRQGIGERNRKVARRLLQAPAFRMRYQNLEEGVSLLGELHASLRP